MYQPFEFDNAVVWITGASSGIGAEFARQLAPRGARLVLSARSREGLLAVQADCVAAGAQDEHILVLPLDVIDYAAMPAATAQVVSHFGRIDLLLNNAGVSQRSFFVDTDFEVYRKMLEINVLGQIALTQAVVPQMLAQGSGHIAVTASVAGKLGAPQRTGYCAAKHAVMGFFDSLRCELAGDDIGVTTITPGFIRTNVAINALDAQGEARGEDDADISGGMPVEDCVRTIIAGFLAGEPEIPVGDGQEMGALALRCSDPKALFGLMAGMAAQQRAQTS
jgi:NADP-dependent 3-hydroxy acid dehydrogenase YdfG